MALRTATRAKICAETNIRNTRHSSWELFFFLRKSPAWYHDGKDDGGHGGLEDPQEGQAQGLDEGEEVDASLWDVAQVDEVRLVLGGHQEQLQSVHELAGSTEANFTRKIIRCESAENRQKYLADRLLLLIIII